MEAQMKAAGYKLDHIDKLLEANRMYIYIFRLDDKDKKEESLSRKETRPGSVL